MEGVPLFAGIFFQPLRQGYLRLAVHRDEVVSTITSHREFIYHADQVDNACSRWEGAVTTDLMELDRGVRPRELIAKIFEPLLSDFAWVPLLDKYDVYEVLMEYWAETMQDDVYAVCYGGYEAGREITHEYVIRKKKENGGEDGLFAQLDDLKRATVAARIREIQRDSTAKRELAALREYMSLLDAESNDKKALKQAEIGLDEKLEKKYPRLTLEEIRHLLAEEKWFAAIYSGIDAIHEAVSHHRSTRVTQLVERCEHQQMLDYMCRLDEV